MQPPFFVFVGEEDQARAVAFIPFEAVDVSSQSEWQSSNPSVVAVSSTGKVTARTVGVTQLTAKYQGLTASSSLAVSQDSDVQAVTIFGCTGSLLVGMTEDCPALVQVAGVTAQVNIAAKATWTSSASSVVSVSAGGHVTAQGTGQAQIAATYHGKTGTMTFNVSQPTQDAVRFQASGTTGQFRPGNAIEIDQTVLYSVVSGSTGRLVMRAYDQTNLLASGSEIVVPRGSDTLLMTLALTIPQTSTRICWAAYLAVGNNPVVSTGDPLLPNLYCRSVTATSP